ncbi:uncharacterized protein LOC129722145 isoform X2 [Wyeomyia smithii]|uniref:uncharacterized protein LOC129722145 isoform X2 n=1 Tax=Wyeomyia smithii TaxID=174621 RepID=UPI002467DB09|nr:uncharacterized protein LOC129722145 isoform X2 [Wyeomyia smithii]
MLSEGVENDLTETIKIAGEWGFPLTKNNIQSLVRYHMESQNIAKIKPNSPVMFAAAADGFVLPPYIVYASVHLYSTWTEGGPKGTRYNRSKSGWFDKVIFEDWFTSMALPYFMNLDNDLPKVIIGDNVASHLSYKVM